MKLNPVQQVGTQKLGYSFAQTAYLGASYHINSIYSNQPPRHHIKCVSPMTFSQKLYQSQASSSESYQQIADRDYEQALTEANLLAKANNLFDQIVSLAE